jgi:type 1 glutamine amidotransferase
MLLASACDDDRPSTVTIDAPDPDASPDARLEGVLDGFCAGQPGRPRVLVYTYENQWRHMSNLYARGAILAMCQTRGFTVDITNDPHSINAKRLANYDVVVFAVTSGSGIDRFGKTDFEAWVRAGGGVVGFEAAASTEQAWPFYVDNIGAAFLVHAPGLQRATLHVTPGHPITDGLPASFELNEQWYLFIDRPENVPGQQILLALDESTLPSDFPAEYRVGYHAIGWAHERNGGRVFYTGLGDNHENWADPNLLELTGRAIEWAAHKR